MLVARVLVVALVLAVAPAKAEAWGEVRDIKCLWSAGVLSLAWRPFVFGWPGSSVQGPAERYEVNGHPDTGRYPSPSTTFLHRVREPRLSVSGLQEGEVYRLRVTAKRSNRTSHDAFVYCAAREEPPGYAVAFPAGATLRVTNLSDARMNRPGFPEDSTR